MESHTDFIAAYEQALATQNWQEVAPLIHERCVATFSEGTYVGKAAVESAFRRTFSLIEDEKYRIDQVHWVLERPNTAAMVFRFQWSGLVDGQPASGAGRGTSVLVKQEGRWQLLCEHLGPPER